MIKKMKIKLNQIKYENFYNKIIVARSVFYDSSK